MYRLVFSQRTAGDGENKKAAQAAKEGDMGQRKQGENEQRK